MIILASKRVDRRPNTPSARGHECTALVHVTRKKRKMSTRGHLDDVLRGMMLSAIYDMYTKAGHDDFRF